MTPQLNDTMRREIEAQPGYLSDGLDSLRTSAGLAAERISGGSAEGLRVWAGGCGDSYFAAVALSELYRTLDIAYAPVTAQDVARYPRVSGGDVVVLISISGSTRRTVEAAHAATDLGARVVAVTCKPDSALGRASDAVIELPYRPISRSTPHTLDYTMSLLAVTALAEALSGTKVDRLSDIGDVMQEALGPADDAARVVGKAATEREHVGAPGASGAPGVGSIPKFFFLGAGPHRGTALYGAAKFYEAGGLPAFAEETENFVHGMNFVVEPRDVGCVIAPEPEDRDRGANLIRGLSELGAHTLAVGFECGDADASVQVGANPGAVAGAFSTNLGTRATWPFLEALPVQLLCLHVTRMLGLEVEKARAGRVGGDVHARVQKDWMGST